MNLKKKIDNKVKKKFFSTPTIFFFDYKSIYFNKKLKKKNIVGSHIFWKSLTWFSHSLTTTQPVQLSTLKFSLNRLEFMNLYNLLLNSNMWLTFTFTDMSNFFYTDVKKIKENFLKKFSFNSELEIVIIDKWFFYSFFNPEYLNTTDLKNDQLTGLLTFKKDFLFWKKFIYANPIPSDIKFFFLKFFSFFSDDQEFLSLNSFLPKSDINNIKLQESNLKDFFFEAWVFIFFSNKNNTIKQQLDLSRVVEYFQLINGYLFTNGFFIFLSELTFFWIYSLSFFKKKVKEKNLSKSLKFLFLNIFTSPNFYFFSKNFLYLHRLNIFYYLFFSLYYFNLNLGIYHFIFLLKWKILYSTTTFINILLKQKFFIFYAHNLTIN